MEVNKIDPNQTYQSLLEYILAGELEEAYWSAIDLRTWIEHGGFYPSEYNAFEVNQTVLSTIRNYESHRHEIAN